jgi:endoglucanase
MFRTQLCLAVVMAAALSLMTAGTTFAGPGGGSPGDGISATRPDGGAALTITDPERTNSGAIYTLFGASTDTIVFGDWNGDGTKSFGAFRDDNGGGLWILDFDGAGSLTYILFGNGTDTPVVGDWDSNSAGDEIGVVRPQGGALRWILRDNSPNGCLCSDFTFGAATDAAAPGNWDGDANNGWEPGVTRADGAAMLWITQGSGGLDYTLFGPSAGIPFPGDWDGDGNTDYGNRPTGGDGNVYILDNGGMLQYYQHGAPTDAGENSGNFGQP